jgi:hypothetical protein
MPNDIHPTEHVFEEDVSCRLRTTEMLEADPYCFRVGWIAWDSAFRQAGLKIEDCIIGVDGVRYDKTNAKEFRHKAVGSYAESQHWKSLGVKEGHIVTLEVKRDREILQIKAPLVADRSWSENMRRFLSPTGPEALGKDNFDSAWSSWYDSQIVDVGWKILDGVWTRTRQDTRAKLKDHQQNAERVHYLVENYPGKFAQSVLDDYLCIEECLKGRLYQIDDAELEWRQMGDARAKQIADSAKTTYTAFLSQHQSDLIDAFPTVDAMKIEERAKVANKLVVLERLTKRDWLMVAGKAWLVASGGNGYYFINLQSPAVTRFWKAEYRYRKLVKPSVSETWSLVGKILPDPKMFVSGGTITGLEVEPMAIVAGEELFVDLSQMENDISFFAGEKKLVNLELPMPADDASPAEVMQAFFHCLKLGEEDEWKKFFAEWDASKWDDDRVYYYALRAPSDSILSSEWLRARKVILSRVYDVRVHWVGEIKVLLEQDAFEGAPKIERVLVEIDHIGLFDGEYRTFQDVNTHRMWTLQRKNSGPWRIAADSRNGI